MSRESELAQARRGHGGFFMSEFFSLIAEYGAFIIDVLLHLDVHLAGWVARARASGLIFLLFIVILRKLDW